MPQLFYFFLSLQNIVKYLFWLYGHQITLLKNKRLPIHSLVLQFIILAEPNSHFTHSHHVSNK